MATDFNKEYELFEDDIKKNNPSADVKLIKKPMILVSFTTEVKREILVKIILFIP